MLNKKILVKAKKALALTLTSAMIATLSPNFVGGILTAQADSGDNFKKSATNTYLANEKFYK